MNFFTIILFKQSHKVLLTEQLNSNMLYPIYVMSYCIIVFFFSLKCLENGVIISLMPVGTGSA